MTEIRVTSKEAGTRLDVFLAEKLHLSRQSIQNALGSGSILVNDERPKPSLKLKADMVISVGQIDSDSAKTQLLSPRVKPQVLYSDSDVIVINKPAGLMTHPVQGGASDSVVGAFAEMISDTDPQRPGVVHRLDKDTSGVLVLARTQASKEFLQKQFRDRSVEKHYQALVWGHLNDKTATIQLPIARSKSNPTSRAVASHGKQAITKYQVTHEYPDYSLLDITLLTGRTHQIRVHFAHLGHPIVGDIVYGKRATPAGLHRQFLHAHTLTIALPNGERPTFQADLPKDLQDFLGGL